MTELIILITLLYAPIIFVLTARMLEFIYLWQIKEYRLDRVLSHLHYEGALTLNDEFEIVIKVMIVVVLILYYMSPLSSILGLVLLIASVYYNLQALNYLNKVIFNKLHRPALRSMRNILIILITIIVISLPYAYLLSLLNDQSLVRVYDQLNYSNPPTIANELVWNMKLATEANGIVVLSLPMVAIISLTIMSALLDLMLPGIVAFGVFMTNPFASLKRKLLIRKGQSHLASFQKVKTIAVTGSYGKTTTKEIISQIAKQKFTTVRTEKNNNTEVGIAKTILRKINSQTEVFVAEMGAYKLKETAMCATIARPTIAIVTGLDEQHFSLYGSIVAIIKSTAEIDDYMQENGVIIINGDDDYCNRLLPLLHNKVILYHTNPISLKSEHKAEKMVKKSKKQDLLNAEILPKDENLYVLSRIENKDGIEFSFGYVGEIYNVKTNLQAMHNIGNLLAAMLSVHLLGLKMREVVEIVNHTKFGLPYLNSYRGINDVEFIDDGYNINPTGYLAGLKYLAKTSSTGKKYVLTQGFVELGKQREEIYRKIATETIKIADGVITTDEYLAYQLKILNADFQVKLIENVFQLPIYLKSILTTQDVVLVEGPLPLQVLKQIKL